MPSELLTRLRRFLDQNIASAIMAIESKARVDNPANPRSPTFAPPPVNTNEHWPNGVPQFGTVINQVQSIMIHETSGWPSLASAANFKGHYRCIDTWDHMTPTGRPEYWVDKRGIGPEYFVDPNGTAYNLIGPQDFAGNARLTWHGEGMSGVSIGIENADLGDADVSPDPGNGPSWFRLPKPADPHPPALPNVPGRKLYALMHPGGDTRDINLIWFADFANADPNRPAGPSDYKESGDLAKRASWRNMLFTERDYRSLALLCRVLAEQYGIPRNFPLLPYLRIEEQTNSDYFRKLLLTYEAQDPIATKLGLDLDEVRANSQVFKTAYVEHAYTVVVGHDKQGNEIRESRIPKWGRFIGWDATSPAGPDLPCFKGFISHAINGNHFCPGPFFDWHRFAREVWDWWWYPFDFVGGVVSSARRPYNQARHDTPLLEYFFDAQGAVADYNGTKVGGALVLEEQFRLTANTPVYAPANGVVLAACLPITSAPLKPGFLLARHEVFHQTSNGLINYDLAPTYVWSLTTYLQAAGFNTEATSDANPDWLNRFVLRLLECEAAVKFHDSTMTGTNATLRNNLRTAWGHLPTGAGPRWSTGAEIQFDAQKYRQCAKDLGAGKATFFPGELSSSPTPVRIILGDFLGYPGPMPNEPFGIQVEIFSKDAILALPGAVRRSSAWLNEPWWQQAIAAIRNEDSDDKSLPADSMLWHYTLTDFLAWVNGVTWSGEWPKYGLPAPMPARPITRIVT